MPKMPPDLPRLLPATDPADRVQVQQTAFSHDVIGRYVCNDWGEIQAQIADRGFPFDVVVIGAGMFGGYLAEKLYREGAWLWRPRLDPLRRPATCPYGRRELDPDVGLTTTHQGHELDQHQAPAGTNFRFAHAWRQLLGWIKFGPT
jgi:hypothetical protein